MRPAKVQKDACLSQSRQAWHMAARYLVAVMEPKVVMARPLNRSLVEQEPEALALRLAGRVFLWDPS